MRLQLFGPRRFRLLRAILAELKGIRLALQQIAANAAGAEPPAELPESDLPPVEILQVDDAMAAELMAIELRLTAASGQIPDYEAVVAEYDRMYGDGAIEAAAHQTGGRPA